MFLGIDLGASTTDFVLFERGKLLRQKSIEAVPLGQLEKEIRSMKWPLSKVSCVCITGGKSASAKKNFLGKPVKKVNEIKAIGAGGLFVSHKKKALVTSLGTGTCIVDAKGNENFCHAGGTGVGGGTLLGLALQLLWLKDLRKINEMAKKGKPGKVDLLVGDIVGKGIGRLPASATASNFAKAGKAGKNDLALGVINMVAETNAVLISLAAEKCGQREVVLTGKLLSVPVFRKRLLACLKILGKKAVVPNDFGVATAIGACV